MAQTGRPGTSRSLATFTLIVCVAAIAALAFWPHPVVMPLTEDAQHCLAFGVLMWLTRGVWPSAPRGKLVGGLLAIGAAIEAVQWAFTPRHAEWRDLAADALGIAVATAISQTLARWSTARQRAAGPSLPLKTRRPDCPGTGRKAYRGTGAFASAATTSKRASAVRQITRRSQRASGFVSPQSDPLRLTHKA